MYSSFTKGSKVFMYSDSRSSPASNFLLSTPYKISGVRKRSATIPLLLYGGLYGGKVSSFRLSYNLERRITMQLKSHPVEKTAEQLRQGIKRLEVFVETYQNDPIAKEKFVDTLIEFMHKALNTIPEEYRK